MRTAQTVLTVIQERGKQHKPIERVYKLLFNRDFYLNAYAKLYPNNGAMTKGVTDETVDGMSIQKIDRMIELLREEKYQWKPARREYIPKKNGKKRPLGIPTWGDKLLQEVMREILEAYYEPQFSNHSHGFRPNRGCHTALQEIQIWKGTRWFIEGDISKYFDTIDHDVLLKILEKNKDELGEIHFFDSVYYTDLASEIAALIKEELENGTKAEEICVIAPQWGMLFDLSRKLRIILPDIPFDAPDISPIKYDPMNPLFLIAKLLFLPSGKNVTLRKRIATEFISIVRDDFRIMVPDNIQNYDVLSAVNCCRGTDTDGITCLGSAIEKVFAILHVRISKEAALSALTNSFFDEIRSRVDRYALSTDFNSISKYFGEKNGVVISTLHGVKGEEYTSVIAAGLLNGYLPHWDYILSPMKKSCRKNETYKLLYVLCSRAKKNLYLFSESGRTTRNGSPYTSTDELSLIADLL